MQHYVVKGTLQYWREGVAQTRSVATTVPAQSAEQAIQQVLSDTCGYLYADRAEWIERPTTECTTTQFDIITFEASCSPYSGGIMKWEYTIRYSDGHIDHKQENAPPHTRNTIHSAHYKGLLDGLHAYLAQGGRGPLRIHCSQELLIRQINDNHKGYVPELQNYATEVRELLQRITDAQLVWIKNTHQNEEERVLEQDLFLPHRLQKSLSPSVRQAISNLNTNPAPSPEHYTSLRTGGLDAFSEMNLITLERQASVDAVALVFAGLPDKPKEQAAALRWVLRGLGVQRAIRKIQADAQNLVKK